jgi:hypothetical protein
MIAWELMTRSCILGIASFSAAVWLSVAGARPACAAPELDVLGSDNKALTFTSDQPVFRFTFTVVAQNAEPVGDVRVVGTPFRDAAGSTQGTGTEWLVKDKVPFQGQLAVPLHATLPAPGEYHAVLALDYGGQRHPFLIKVVRPPAPAPKDLPIATSGATVTDVVLPPGALETKLVIRNDGRETLRLKPGGVSFALARAAELVSTNATASATLDKVEMTADGTATVTIHLTGLTDPGKYQGKVRLTAEQASYKPLDVEFAVLAKRSASHAAGLIAAGVLVSFLFNQIFNKRRARLVARRDLARVRERCDALDRGDLKERERAMVAAVRRELDELAIDVQFGIDAGRRDALARIRRKVDLLALALETVRFVGLLDPAGAATTRQALDVAAGKLRDPAITLDELGKAYDELRDLKTRTDLRVALKRGIDAVTALAGAQRAVPAGPAELGAKLASVQAHLDEATRLHAADELDQAIVPYDLARTELVPILAAALEARMQKKLEPFEDDAWGKLVAELGPLLAKVTASRTPDAQIAAYHDAQARFYRGAFEAIATRATKLAGARPAYQAEFSSLAARVSGDAASNELVRADDAGARFTEALAELTRIDKATTRDATSFTVAAPTGGSALPRSIPDKLAMPPRRVASSMSLQRTVDRSDVVALFGLLAISVLSGVQLLWSGDATWGSFDSKLLAFLWGLGLHSVGNQPFKNTFQLSSLLTDQPVT